MPLLLPRGIRNCNPGNLDRNAIHWQGMSTLQDDPRFIRFETPEFGLRALMKLLITYEEKYSCNTIRKIISRFAPPTENDTGAYINAVAIMANVDYDVPIDVKKYLVPLAQSIVFHENGAGFVNYPRYWYTNDVYAAAASAALT